MPTISVNQKLLASLLSKHGCSHDIADVDHRLPLLGTDIDRCDDEVLDIEIFPNRPDLLSAETLSLAMRGFLHNQATLTSTALKYSIMFVLGCIVKSKFIADGLIQRKSTETKS